jgi:hypothetical protein
MTSTLCKCSLHDGYIPMAVVCSHLAHGTATAVVQMRVVGREVWDYLCPTCAIALHTLDPDDLVPVCMFCSRRMTNGIRVVGSTAIDNSESRPSPDGEPDFSEDI